MHKIIEKRVLNPQVKLIKIDAPFVAKKAEPGQFVMLRINETGERIPLTIADYDRKGGTITLIFQEIGKTTKMLGDLNVGEGILDVAGPLGVASHLEGIKSACVIGGGLGCAIAYPQAKRLYELGARVDIIAGFRNEELIFLEDEMRAVSDRLFVMTDDGSNGNKGLVTDELKNLLDAGEKYDIIIAIGPLVMMKYVALTSKPYGVKTIVSMNPVMVDGTGMCGGCRVTVGGETKFACVDGPDFDAHEVDFDEAIRRSSMYKEQEQHAIMSYDCRLSGGKTNG